MRGNDGEILCPRIWRGTLRHPCALNMELKEIVPKMLAELGLAPWLNEGDGSSIQGEKTKDRGVIGTDIMGGFVWSLGDGF